MLRVRVTSYRLRLLNAKNAQVSPVKLKPRLLQPPLDVARIEVNSLFVYRYRLAVPVREDEGITELAFTQLYSQLVKIDPAINSVYRVA